MHCGRTVITDPKKPLSDTLHMDLRISSDETAAIMMRDLIRKIAAGEVRVLAVTENTDNQGLAQSLEITYVETKGTKQ